MTVAPSGVLTTLILSVAAMAMTHLCLPMDASWIDITANTEDVSIEITSHYIHGISLHIIITLFHHVLISSLHQSILV